VVAVVAADGAVSWHVTEHFRDVPALAGRIGVDIPIGLPDRGRRAVETEVRRHLPGRGSTVFPTPVRAVLAARDYAEACAISRERCDGRAISRQTWLITSKIAEVDAVLAADPALDERIAEAHPELAFATMNGGTPVPRKKSAEGAAARHRLLTEWLGGPVPLPVPRPAGVAADDLLDALACAWVARRWVRGTARVHQDLVRDRDRTGRPMRIVC
jgi:predicted RNase H-like nuclease